MSEFKVSVVNLQIKNHPNADRLEVAEIGDYQCIVQKGQYKNGELQLYIPEAAILPEWLIEALNLTGRLAGPDKNRVKAIKLRGVVSQGLICPIDYAIDRAPGGVLSNDVDITEILGIKKYEPEVPAQLSGNVWNAGQQKTLRYDIENIKNSKYKNVLKEGEEVVFTEKLHGTWCMAALMPPLMKDKEQGNFVVSSKGQASKGLAIKMPQKGSPQTLKQKLLEWIYTLQKSWNIFLFEHDVFGPFPEEELNKLNKKLAYIDRKIRRKCYNPGVNENNTYWKAVMENKVFKGIVYAFPNDWPSKPIFILGEVLGVQDLKYGFNSSKPGFRVFDIYIGVAGQGRYLNDDELDTACRKLRLQRVPVLYRGPFSKEVMGQYTSGKESVTGASGHIREGIVIRPVVERHDDTLGRVQLKSVSEEYLLRKGNTTEYQ